MKIELEVEDEKIENALVGCFDGGASRYWIKHIASIAPKGAEPLASWEAPMTEGHKVVVTLDEPTTKDGPKTYDLDRAAIERGVALMAAKQPRHFGNLMDETDDGTTHDVMLQMCLFGEVVFG